MATSKKKPAVRIPARKRTPSSRVTRARSRRARGFPRLPDVHHQREGGLSSAPWFAPLAGKGDHARGSQSTNPKLVRKHGNPRLPSRQPLLHLSVDRPRKGVLDHVPRSRNLASFGVAFRRAFRVVSATLGDWWRGRGLVFDPPKGSPPNQKGSTANQKGSPPIPKGSTTNQKRSPPIPKGSTANQKGSPPIPKGSRACQIGSPAHQEGSGSTLFAASLHLLAAPSYPLASPLPPFASSLTSPPPSPSASTPSFPRPARALLPAGPRALLFPPPRSSARSTPPASTPPSASPPASAARR